MSERALKLVEQMKRAPLSDVPERLRILADELPEGTEGAIVILHPSGEAYSFGSIDDRMKAVGILFHAAQRLAAGET